jgi:hypothetical protein
VNTCDEVYTNTIEGFFATLKRGIMGTYHHVSEQHLNRYLAEFSFRPSERAALGVEDRERATKTLKGIIGKGDDRIKGEQAAQKWAEAFGLFTEVIAVSGARPSQTARLNVLDLAADGEPRLMMPSSKKGRGVKKVLRWPMPILVPSESPRPN